MKHKSKLKVFKSRFVYFVLFAHANHTAAWHDIKRQNNTVQRV